jgi:hypothetical protein
MHTYKKTTDDPRHGQETWTVGYWGSINVTTGVQIWHGMRSFKLEREAAAFTNYLNGGTGGFYPFEKV